MYSEHLEPDTSNVKEPKAADVEISSICNDEFGCGFGVTLDYPINKIIARVFEALHDGIESFEITYRVEYNDSSYGDLEMAVEAYKDDGVWTITVYEQTISEKGW